MDELTPSFAGTVKGLHAVAEQIVASARKPQNEIALFSTPGGFGTPGFEWEGEVHVVRVDGIDLVHEAGGGEERVRIESLAGAAELVAGLLPEPPTDDSPLNLDPASAATLAAWYALGEQVLVALTDDEDDLPVLWPEHFDIAIVTGDEASGARANVGFSPGDEEHDEPYLYVGPWDQGVSGELWNAKGFTGAEMGYSELSAAGDAADATMRFCRERLAALAGTG